MSKIIYDAIGKKLKQLDIILYAISCRGGGENDYCIVLNILDKKLNIGSSHYYKELQSSYIDPKQYKSGISERFIIIDEDNVNLNNCRERLKKTFDIRRKFSFFLNAIQDDKINIDIKVINQFNKSIKK